MAAWIYLFLGMIWVSWASTAQAELQVTPSLSVFEQYYDNVLFAETDKVDDFATAVFPSLAFTDRVWDIGLSGNLGGGVTVFAENPNLSFFDGNANILLDADTVAGRIIRGLGFTVFGSVMATNDPFGFGGGLSGGLSGLSGGTGIGITPAGGQTRGLLGFLTSRNAFVTNTVGVRSSYDFSPRSEVTVGYSNNRYLFSDVSLFDVVTDTSDMKWRYDLTPRTTALSSYTFQRFSFDSGSQDNHFILAGIERQVLKDLNVSIEGGAFYLPSQNSFSPLARGSAEWYPTKTATVSLMFDRYIQSSQGLSDQLTTNDTASASVSYQLTSRAMLTLVGEYFKFKTIGAQAQSSAFELSGFVVGPSLMYSLTQTTTLFASYNRMTQSFGGNLDPSAGLNVDLNLASVGMTIEWP